MPSLNDPIRMIGLLPDNVPFQDMLPLVDCLLSAPVEAVVVEVAGENGLLLLQTLLEEKRDQMVVGAGGDLDLIEAQWEALDFVIAPETVFDCRALAPDVAADLSKQILSEERRNLFYRGPIKTAAAIQKAHPRLKIWSLDIASPADAAVWIDAGFFGIVPLLWHHPEQTLTQTIQLARTYRQIILSNAV